MGTTQRMALGIGASQASGMRGNFGTMTKPFHPGNACRAGVTAAKMALKGYETNPGIAEHRFGYAAGLASGPSDPRRVEPRFTGAHAGRWARSCA